VSELKCPSWVQVVSKRVLFLPYDVLSVWMVDIPVLRICAVDAVFWSGIRGTGRYDFDIKKFDATQRKGV